jgi:hypothetical protein
VNINFHIGYHKTGTTFLQEKIFSNLSDNDAVFIGQPFMNQEFNNFFQILKDINELDFDPEKFQRSFYHLCKENNIGDDKKIIVSLESLSSGFDWFGREFSIIIRKISLIFPNAKLLIGFRDPSEFTEAIYKEYIIHGGKFSFKWFLYDSHYFQYSVLPKLDYEKVQAYIARYFPGERVQTYTLQNLKQDPEKVITNILLFLGIRQKTNFDYSVHYAGLSRHWTELIRVYNILFVRDADYAVFLRGFPTKWSFSYKFRRRLISTIRSFSLKYPLKSSYMSKNDKDFIVKSIANQREGL